MYPFAPLARNSTSFRILSKSSLSLSSLSRATNPSITISCIAGDNMDVAADVDVDVVGITPIVLFSPSILPPPELAETAAESNSLRLARPLCFTFSSPNPEMGK